MRFPSTTLLILALSLPSASGVAVRLPQGAIGLPSEHLSFQQQSMKEQVDDYFQIAPKEQAEADCQTAVLEAPVRQEDFVKLYIAIDGDSFCSSSRPGNGGLRLLQYESDEDAVADAVRLAKGMTRKHDAFRTGFSGAKLVAQAIQGVDKVCRKTLMEDTAAALKVLSGTIYTGCDLNTSDGDMNHLVEATQEKYVLAGRNSKVDTNVATAASVIGSILGLCDAHEKDLSELTFTVQGCGKVGKTVASELVRMGAKKVQTCDIVPGASDLPRCEAIDDWENTPCDFLVPCANSLAITEEVAKSFPEGLQFCTGATNSPFATDKAKKIFEERGVSHVPESISSAGAILADSVEWHDQDLFQTVEPTLMYGWVRSLSRNKAKTMAKNAGLDATKMRSVLHSVTPSRSGTPIGESFPEYIEEHTRRVDTLIVGGGMAGTAAAFGLSQKGQKSLLVERGASLAPGDASSNGDSRMYRQMYSDEFFSRMQTAALKRWRDVEEITGKELLQKNGLLFYGEDTGETVEGSVLGAKQTMESLGLPHTFYESGDEIADAFPALEGCRGQPYSGVQEDTAGHIRASKACAAMVEAAGDSCEVKVNTKIASLVVNSEDEEGRQAKSSPRIQACTEDGEAIFADNCVIAAGAWTNDILGMAGLPKLNLKVWQVQWGHYKVTDPKVAATIPQAFFFRKPESDLDGGLFYVFPASATECKDDDCAYVKVGVDFRTGDELENMSSFDFEGSEEVRKLMDGWVAEHLPGVGERVDSYTSPYTMTEDSYFVMDNIADGVTIFSGGSGRAFKFGPLLGDCLAALTTGDTSPVDLTRFSCDRGLLIHSDVPQLN